MHLDMEVEAELFATLGPFDGFRTSTTKVTSWLITLNVLFDFHPCFGATLKSEVVKLVVGTRPVGNLLDSLIP